MALRLFPICQAFQSKQSIPSEAFAGCPHAFVFRLAQFPQEESLVSFGPKVWSSHADARPTCMKCLLQVNPSPRLEQFTQVGAFFGNACLSPTEHGRSVCADQEPLRAFNFPLDQHLDEVSSWIQLGGIQRDPVGALVQGQ